MTENKATEFKISATGNYVPSQKITCSKDSVEFAKQFYNDDIAIYESAFIILINRAHNVIGWAKISQGGICATVVDLRIVAKFAIDVLASGVIFVHNHPTGNMRPSIQDDTLTRRMKDGLKLLEIELLDSVIISPDGSFYSYTDEGKM